MAEPTGCMQQGGRAVNTYHFTIEVGGIDPEADGLEDRLHGSGAGDALIYLSGGRLFLAFDREAPNEGTAIDCAAHDVHRCGGNVVKIIRENLDDVPWMASPDRASPLSG